jgi:hypothetical protein
MESVGVCMLTTRFAGGLRARPLESRPDRDAGIIWFMTDLHSAKEYEIETENDVGLAFIDAKANGYLSITARAEVRHDHAKATEIWKPTDNMWFLPQPSAGFTAAPHLQAPQEPRAVARRSPELPGDHACAVPDRILVGPRAPQIDMPAEAINWLSAYAAKSGTPRVCAFPKGRGWCPECGWQPVLAVVVEPPAPSAKHPAAGSKRARQAIGAKWMRAPI